MLIPALSKRVPVWGGNNACLYPARSCSLQSPEAPVGTLQAPLLIAFLADVPRLKDDKSVSQG